MSHPPNVHKYTVGWLCALPIELAASKLVLDEQYQGLGFDPNDETKYSLGSIGNHNVVMGCLPAGEIGIGAAATVATRMRAKFPNIRFGLMVGIGGGVPSHADVRLGDVVVSQPVGDRRGVIQYDLGKSTPDGFLHTGSLNAPPQVLRQAVANLQARHICDGGNISSYLAVIENKAKRFSRPPSESDILFSSACEHVHGESTCEKCDLSQAVSRKSRDHNDVVIHYGTIASGNRVIKSARERDALNKKLGGVLCFEMEAAGLMNNFDCLVIRGICDYADSHKNKDWQPYAAAVAAAFAKELLVETTPITVINTTVISVCRIDINLQLIAVGFI